MDVVSTTVSILGVFATSITLLGLYRWRKTATERGKIEVTRVELSDDGKVLDITYLIKKPGRVLDRRGKVYLLEELRAKKIDPASHSELRNVIDINSRLNPTGSIRLPNKHKLVRKGSLVTVAIGDYRRENLIVV